MSKRVLEALDAFDRCVKPNEFSQHIKLMRLEPGEYNRGFRMDVAAFEHLIPGSDAMEVAVSLIQKGAVPFIAIDESGHVCLHARVIRERHHFT